MVSLVKAAGDEWLASNERAKTGVVVNTNNVVDDVNNNIKSALQSEGKISKEGVQIETYHTINLQTPKNRFANNYYDADAIRFHRNYKRLGVKAGDIYKIDNIDFDRGILNLVSGDHSIEFKPARMFLARMQYKFLKLATQHLMLVMKFALPVMTAILV